MSNNTNKTWSERALTALNHHLSSAESLLQYGCGETTSIACGYPNVKYIYAVESDKSVADSIYDTLTDKDKLRMMYADIGELDANGIPINHANFANYHQYMVFPWALADKYNVIPELIVIDGHFKVASFLYSLICAKEGATILFNDFFTSSDYGIARNYALLEERHGDMAEFKVQKNFVMSELAAMIAKYSVIV